MAIEDTQIPAPPVEAPPPRLRLLREPKRTHIGDRRARFVNVHPSSDGDGSWTCNCICGWNGKRLRFRTEDLAERAGELHLRVCSLLHR